MSKYMNRPQTSRHEQEANSRIAVLCVGNILMRDEGVGPRIAAELNSRFDFDILEGKVDVLDCATMGLSLLNTIASYDNILVVDAVDGTGLEPGTVVRFSPEDIAPYEAFHGAHDARFADVLQAAALMGHATQGSCLGVQVADMNPVDYTIGLTPQVEAALPLLIYETLSYLEANGVVLIDKTTNRVWNHERIETQLSAEDFAMALTEDTRSLM